MAIVKLNDLFKDVSGSIGELELSRRRDKTVVRHKPEVRPLATPARLANRERFRTAALYGRTVQSTPALAAVYAPAARSRGVAPYHVALKDFLNPPEVTDIDLRTLPTPAAGPIRVSAIDDFQVVQVWLSLRTTEDQMIEEGAATLDLESGQWLYHLQTEIVRGQTVVVTATATDRPGHHGSSSVFCWIP